MPKFLRATRCLAATCALLLEVSLGRAADGIQFEGKSGPGLGKNIVLLAGDEEYRSEEGLPMLARILADRHGFHCTVLFSVNADGFIDPDCQTNLPGIEALDHADLCIMQLRFRELPDSQMEHFVNYWQSGKPIIALRTSTHAFAYSRHTDSPYARFDWSSRAWPGGFGQQVLGETWVSHHGEHGKESTRGIINAALANHPILRGVDHLWWPSDVYTVQHLPGDAQTLVFGQVLSGMNPADTPVEGPKNNPMMPVIWIRHYRGESGKTSKILTATTGAAVDLQNEGLRRLLVNAAYWAVNMEDKIPARADVDYVGPYAPSFFGFGTYKRGVRPSDLAPR